MRVTRETLIHVAKETAKKRSMADPGLVAAYLTGSLLTENPFIGNSTDIDIVLVHTRMPKFRREILPVTPEVHLDIVHNPRSEYEKPKELRVHPWLGPELYDPMPLYERGHFLEFFQAGVRADFDEPINVMARARRNAEHARQIWEGLTNSEETGPDLLLAYLKGISHAANAIALLTGVPLSVRRFIPQFQERASAVGASGLSAGLLGLLGGARVDLVELKEFLPKWEKTFLDAASRKKVHASIAVPRLAYFELAFNAMLTSEFTQNILWPLVLTWTQAAAVLPPTHQENWLQACETLGLYGDAFSERLEGLDHFLDTIEELLENMASSQGL